MYLMLNEHEERDSAAREWKIMFRDDDDEHQRETCGVDVVACEMKEDTKTTPTSYISQHFSLFPFFFSTFLIVSTYKQSFECVRSSERCCSARAEIVRGRGSNLNGEENLFFSLLSYARKCM
jgi:hypothetical protein